MDINHIFNLFGGSDKSKPVKAEDDPINFENFEKTPTYKIGMFKKIILNQTTFQKQLINMFKTPNDEFEVEGLESTGEYIAHHRAWSYISSCNLEDEMWRDCLSVQHDDYLETAIKLSVSFFEESEEYEKCAFLVKIQKFLKNSLELES